LSENCAQHGDSAIRFAVNIFAQLTVQTARQESLTFFSHQLEYASPLACKILK
jgi:hypothetical protein